MSTAVTTMLWIGLTLEASAIVLLIVPEWTSPSGSPDEDPAAARGAPHADGPRPVVREAKSISRLSKWSPRLGLALALAGLGFLIQVAIAIT